MIKALNHFLYFTLTSKWIVKRDFSMSWLRSLKRFIEKIIFADLALKKRFYCRKKMLNLFCSAVSIAFRTSTRIPSIFFKWLGSISFRVASSESEISYSTYYNRKIPSLLAFITGWNIGFCSKNASRFSIVGLDWVFIIVPFRSITKMRSPSLTH